jgi:hypothetical protein
MYSQVPVNSVLVDVKSVRNHLSVNATLPRVDQNCAVNALPLVIYQSITSGGVS